jgi:hypothetical protein
MGARAGGRSAGTVELNIEDGMTTIATHVGAKIN